MNEHCQNGGIGRRTGLKIPRPIKACRFNPDFWHFFMPNFHGFLKLLKKNSAIPLLALSFLFFTIPLLSKPIEVAVFSDLNFAPQLFDMIKSELETTLKARCTLRIYPISEMTKEKDFSHLSCLMYEEHKAKAPSNLTENFIKSNFYIDLLWLLTGSEKKLRYIYFNHMSLDYEGFLNILRELRKRDSDHFPWLESLGSTNTLFNFHIIFNDNLSLEEQAEAEIPLKQIFEKAAEENLLNPISTKADLFLAAEAFNNEDAVFVSQWLPAKMIFDKKTAEIFLPPSIIIPFPSPKGLRTVPFVRLSLWINKDSDSFHNLPIGFSPPDTFKLRKLHQDPDELKKWILKSIRKYGETRP